MDYYRHIKYFEKYLQEELNEEEAAEFNSRLASDMRFLHAFQAFKKDLLKENRAVSDSSFGKSKAWAHVQGNIYRPSQTPTKTREKRQYGAKTVAVVFLIFLGGLGYMAFERDVPGVEMITKATARGQKSTITLSDGSRVKLNSDSKLVYPKRFGTDSRTVHLAGEAFFDVTPDPRRPFVVQSGDIQTHVLGTSFNIHAFPDEDLHKVAVKTGTIRLSFSGSSAESVQLGEGEQLHYRPALRAWEKSLTDPHTIAYWAEGYLYFENEPLEKVLKALSRWYGVDFQINHSGIMDCRITLKQRNESLKNIMEILNYAIGLDFELKENEIIINGKPC